MIELFGESIDLDYNLALIIVAVCVGGFVRGFTGFGSALVIIPSLALVFSPREAVAMHAVMEVPVILSMLPKIAGRANRQTVPPMLLGLTLATPCGAFVLYSIDPGLMKIAISLVVLIMVAMLFFRKNMRLNITGAAAGAAGVIGGILQGATGIGGPPVVIALMSRGDDIETVRANVFTVMSAMIAISIASFWWFGLLTPTVLLFGCLSAPFCLAGTMLGARAFRTNASEYFNHFAMGLLVVLASITLYSALTS